MTQDEWRIVGWSAAAIGAILTLAAVVWAIRRWMKRNDEGTIGPVFTLQDLREMRDGGLILPEEYEKMRAGILASASTKTSVAQPAGGSNTRGSSE